MQVLKWRAPALALGAVVLLSLAVVPGVVSAGMGGEEPPAACDETNKTGAIVAGPRGRAVVKGTEGDDRFLVRGPGKKIYGFGGNDTICYRGTDTAVLVDGGAGSDYIFVNNFAADTIYGGPGDDVIWSTGGDDQVFGDDGDDRVFAGDGVDQVMGGTGADTLRGGTGTDNLYGADGADRCFGDTEYDASSGCELNEAVENTASAPPAPAGTTTTTTTAPPTTTTTAVGSGA